MNRISSISLLIMGTGFLPLALILDNLLLKCAALCFSILLNVVAIVMNFKEKHKKKL